MSQKTIAFILFYFKITLHIDFTFYLYNSKHEQKLQQIHLKL